MRRFAETPLINYEGRYSYGDHLTLRLFIYIIDDNSSTTDSTVKISVITARVSDLICGIP